MGSRALVVGLWVEYYTSIIPYEQSGSFRNHRKQRENLRVKPHRLNSLRTLKTHRKTVRHPNIRITIISIPKPSSNSTLTICVAIGLAGERSFDFYGFEFPFDVGTEIVAFSRGDLEGFLGARVLDGVVDCESGLG